MIGPDQEWRNANRANWDERVAIRLAAECYDLAPLRAGRGRLNPIEEAELGPVDGLRVLHLQCHFGRDSLILAQRGGRVVGIDFSGPAIAAARNLAAELGLGERARFVEANLYAAPSAVAEPGSFDLAFVTWAAINWLPDTRRWAEIVAWFLQPGGALYLAEGHPIALVLDDAAPGYGDMPGWYVPYFHREPLVFNDPAGYANEAARLQNARTYEWIHPLGEIVSGLLDAGLALRWLHEHESVPWRMFKVLVQDVEGMYRWPFSLRAKRSS